VSWHEVPRRLQVRYLHAAAITVAQLVRLVGELEQDCGNRGALKLMLRRLQGLAAWAGLHGLSMIAVAAQLGEHDCATLAGAGLVPQAAHLEQIRSLVHVLRQQVYRLRTTGGISEEILWARSAPKDADPARAPHRPPHRALAVGLQEVDWEHLEGLLLHQGFALQAVETCREAGRVFAIAPPDAVIAAADLPDGSGTLLTHYLRSLERGDDPVVVVVGDAPAEGSAAPVPTRFGSGCDADARFNAPVDWTALAQRLAALLERRQCAPRVLYLESDDDEAGGVYALLRGAGYRVRRCRDPRRFAREALTCEPELALIDLPPAGEIAAELVRWLRGDKRCATLPVILLAAEDGEEQLPPGIGMGGTERVAKPVAAQSLLSKVAARIEHGRALKLLFAQSGPDALDPAPRERAVSA
jgi:DNA-binding response OmpR family regulator